MIQITTIKFATGEKLELKLPLDRDETSLSSADERVDCSSLSRDDFLLSSIPQDDMLAVPYDECMHWLNSLPSSPEALCNPFSPDNSHKSSPSLRSK